MNNFNIILLYESQIKCYRLFAIITFYFSPKVLKDSDSWSRHDTTNQDLIHTEFFLELFCIKIFHNLIYKWMCVQQWIFLVCLIYNANLSFLFFTSPSLSVLLIKSTKMHIIHKKQTMLNVLWWWWWRRWWRDIYHIHNPHNHHKKS